MEKKPNENRSSWLVRLLVYVICLLAAVATWLLVMYVKQGGATEDSTCALAPYDCVAVEGDTGNEYGL